MPRQNWTTVSIRNERLQKLERMFNRDAKRPKNQSFNAYLDNLLYEIIDHDDKLREYGPFIRLDNTADNHILLTDNILNKHIFVNVNSLEKRLECEVDERSDCVHVGYCYAIPVVYRILIEKGFRPLSPIQMLGETVDSVKQDLGLKTRKERKK